MKCEKIRKNLSAYADGELGGKLRQQIAGHLSVCEKCAEELSSLEKIAGMAKSSLREMVSAKVPPSDLRAQVMRAVESEKAPRTVMISVRRLVAGTALVALMAGFLMGIVLESRFRSQREVFRREIAEQRRILDIAQSNANGNRTQLLAARATLIETEEKLRLAQRRASEGDQIAAETATGKRYAWRPVLSSLQMPGARSLLENGLF